MDEPSTTDTCMKTYANTHGVSIDKNPLIHKYDNAN